MALFLTQTPSYMGLGFECRDQHFSPAPNEHYTKLFVFQERSGPKATLGPYVWGRNAQLFSKISALRRFADSIWSQIKEHSIQWLLLPDATANNQVIAWTQADTPEWIFVANTDIQQPAGHFGLPLLFADSPAPELKFIFSTDPAALFPGYQNPAFNGKHYLIASLSPGEGRVYQVNQ